MMRLLYLAILAAILPLQGYQTHYASHVEGDGRIGGFRRGGGVIGWVPVRHDNNRVAFTQLAGGYYLDQYVGTVGLGYRQACNRHIGWGVNGFADFSRSTVHDKSYAQGGVGAELFGACWDARINAYFPTSNRRFLGSVLRNSFTVITEEGASIEDIFSPVSAKAYYGGDVEAGLRLCLCDVELRGYGGYYAYHAHNVKVVQGPRVRGEVRKEGLIFPQLTLRVGGEWQTDRIHGNDVSLLVGASWDFGRCKRTPCCQSACSYLGERVYRQPAPWVLTSIETSTDIAFEEIFVFFVAEGGTGPGTQLDPTNLTDVQTLAGEGDIIILLNDNGTIVPTATFVLETDQQLGGFLNNPSITVTLPNGQQMVIFNINMSGPALLDPAADLFALIQLASGNNLFNFETSGGTETLVGTGFSGLTMDSLTLADATTTGIDFTSPAGSITVTNTTLTPASGAEVVNVMGGTATASMGGLTSTGDSGLIGIFVQSTAGGSYTFGPTTLTDYTAQGVALSNNAAAFTFNRTTISDTTGADSIALVNQMGNVTFSSGTVTQSGGGHSVVGLGGAAVVNLAGLTLTNTGTAVSTGIDVMDTTGGSYTFGPTTLTDHGVDAIALTSNAAAFTFNSTTISDSTAGRAILLSGQTGDVTFVTGTISQPFGGEVVTVSGGSGNLNLSGFTAISNVDSTVTPISVSNMSGGSFSIANVALVDITSTLVSPTQGVSLQSNDSVLTLDSVTVNGGGDSFVNVDASGNTRMITYRNSFITSNGVAAAQGVRLVSNTGPILFDAVNIGGIGGTYTDIAFTCLVHGADLTYTNSTIAVTAPIGIFTAMTGVGLFDNLTISGDMFNTAVLTEAHRGLWIFQESTVSNISGRGVTVEDQILGVAVVARNSFPAVATVATDFLNALGGIMNIQLVGNTETGPAGDTDPTYQFTNDFLQRTNITVGSTFGELQNRGGRITAGAGINIVNDGFMTIVGGTTLDNVDARNVMATDAISSGSRAIPQS